VGPFSGEPAADLRAAGPAESTQRYASRRNDEELKTKLLEAAREKPRWGYWRLQFVLDQKVCDQK